MNNEPVAWMCPTGLEYKQRATDFMYNDGLYDKKLNWIPLYTHPAELTDEEIEAIASKHLCYQIEGSEVSGVFNFARAILKKASEK
jgi:hypothetical protein